MVSERVAAPPALWVAKKPKEVWGVGTIVAARTDADHPGDGEAFAPYRSVPRHQPRREVAREVHRCPSSA